MRGNLRVGPVSAHVPLLLSGGEASLPQGPARLPRTPEPHSAGDVAAAYRAEHLFCRHSPSCVPQCDVVTLWRRGERREERGESSARPPVSPLPSLCLLLFVAVKAATGPQIHLNKLGYNLSSFPRSVAKRGHTLTRPTLLALKEKNYSDGAAREHPRLGDQHLRIDY